MHPKLKEKVFEDLVNKIGNDTKDYIELVGDIILNSPEMDGEVFDVDSFLNSHKNEIKKMYISNKRPVQAANELLQTIRR